MYSNIEVDDNIPKDIERRLETLEKRVSDLESHFPPMVEDRVALYLTVPDTLRKSLFAVSQLAEATADEVCNRTGRHRSIENKYLNELVRAGWLARQRKGKKVYYSPKKRKEVDLPAHGETIDELDDKLGEILE